MEKKSIRIIAIIFLIVFGIALFLLLKDKTEPTEDALKFKEEYEEVNKNQGAVQISIKKNNPITYLDSYEELNKKIENKDSFILYLGFPTCPWCRNIVPVLFSAAAENDVDKVYYLNTSELKNKDSGYDDLYKLIYDYLTDDTEGNKVLYVPDVYFFKNGEIIGHHLGSVNSQINPTIPLTDSQVKELKNIYSDLITKIK